MQSERDSIPPWERRDDISLVRNENGSQPSRDVSPASDRQSSSIDGYSPQTLGDPSQQERQRDIAPPRDRQKSRTLRHSGLQSRGDNTPTKNAHRQERQRSRTPPRDEMSDLKRRRPPERGLSDRYRSHQPRDDSLSRDRNFSQMDTSPRRRRRCPEKSPPPRGKLRDHLQQQGPTRGPPRERYDRDPNPPRSKDRYVWEPSPTRERVRCDRDFHKYDREADPYRERDRYDRDSNPRGRDRYGEDYYPPRERCDKYEGETKIPHVRYDRPTQKDASPAHREYRYDSRLVLGSQIQRYPNTPPQRKSYYGQMSRESGYPHPSPSRRLSGYDQYDSEENRRRFEEETRRQNVYRHRPVQRKSAIIYSDGWY